MLTKFYRKRNRLPFKELYQGGHWYFVTICIKDREEILSQIVEAMPSSPLFKTAKTSIIGKYVEKAWYDNLKFYQNIILDEFVIMPNHLHGIIGLNNKNNNLGKIIKGFKRKALFYIKQNIFSKNNENTKSRNENILKNGDEGIASTADLIQTYNTIWQKSFYDHIIRSEKDLDRIREYIIYNPLNWHLDSLNSVNGNNNLSPNSHHKHSKP